MSKKTSGKENVSELKDDDLFGDFKELDEFITSDSFEVVDENTHSPGNFELSSKDKKKKAGHAKPPEEKQVDEDDLFGEFKSLEEFERSDSFEVTKTTKTSNTSNEPDTPKQVETQKREVTSLEDDDLFGDFKSLEEFENSNTFEVTKSPTELKKVNQSTTSKHTGPTVDRNIDPENLPSPVSTFALKKAQQADQTNQVNEPPKEVLDPTKQKLAAIAEKRKKRKKTGTSDDLFSDLDEFDLDDD